MQISISLHTVKKLKPLSVEQISKVLQLWLNSTQLGYVKLKRRQMQTKHKLRLTNACLELIKAKAHQLGIRPEYLASYAITAALSTNGLESYWQLKLHEELGGKREVLVPCGRIDLLTSTKLIEVKHSGGWKGAIGQALCYAVYWPKHKPCIALFGSMDRKHREIVEHCCAKYDVEIIWLEG